MTIDEAGSPAVFSCGVVHMVFGSYLYGTDSPESDRDYKGIFLPHKKEIYLGKIPKSITTNTKRSNHTKNTSIDIDNEVYSLHYFIELACEGQTVAIDMLYAPNDMIIYSSDIWEEIVKERSRFNTKNLKAFIGYARRQASKYGVKGSRLAAAKHVLDFCDHSKDLTEDTKLRYVWAILPIGEHIHKLDADQYGIRFYQVCGRKISDTCSMRQLRDIVYNFYLSYGERARLAESNSGIDWKAVSHAFRAAYQVKEILTTGEIVFPLKEAQFLRGIKSGNFDYTNYVAPKLDELMTEVEDLAAKSKLPEKVNRKFWDDFLIRVIEEHVK